MSSHFTENKLFDTKGFIIGLYGEIQLLHQYLVNHYHVEYLTWMEYVSAFLKRTEHYDLQGKDVYVQFHGERQLIFEQKFSLSILPSYLFLTNLSNKNLTPLHIRYLHGIPK